MSHNIFDGIKIPRNILKITGNWPEAPTIWSRIRGLISSCIATILLITMVMELAKQLDDYEDLTDHLAVTISMVSLWFKLTIFKSEYRQFLELLRRLGLEIFNNHPGHLDVIMKKSIRISNLIGLMYQPICYTVLLMYLVMPFFANVDLPIRFSYNLGSFKSLMYMFQVLGK